MGNIVFLWKDQEVYEILLDGETIGTLYKDETKLWQLRPNHHIRDEDLHAFLASSFSSEYWEHLASARQSIRQSLQQYKAMRK